MNASPSIPGIPTLPLAIAMVRPDPALPATDELARRLAAGVAAGDEASFRARHDAYAGRVRRLVLSLARGDEALADDITQRTLLTAAGKLGAVEGEAHLWNWLARVARQHLGKEWRRQRRAGTPLPLEEDRVAAEESTPPRPLEHALAAAVDTLPDDERSLLRGFYEEGRSQQALAEERNTTPKAVANRLDRLRDKLRRLVLERLRHEES